MVEADIGSPPFRLTLDGGDVWTCESLIIATGAQARWLGLPSEDRFKGFGVSACATCELLFWGSGKEVERPRRAAAAVEEALYLSHLASKVTVIHRRDTFRAEYDHAERPFKKPDVRGGVERPLARG